MAMRQSGVFTVWRSQMGRFVRRVNGAAAMGRAAIALLAIVTAAFFSAMAMAKSASEPIRIVALGDSLTAGFGVPRGQAFPDQLQAALRAKGLDVEVINAGVSGDTTSDALARFDWAVPANADAVIVELGANDALRGLDPKRARASLDAILARIAKLGLPMLLSGMAAPRNMGPDYVAAFDRIYPELAKAHGAILDPFFLEGVALKPDLNQGDGIHPTAKGVAVIVARLLPAVEQLIARARERRAASR